MLSFIPGHISQRLFFLENKSLIDIIVQYINKRHQYIAQLNLYFSIGVDDDKTYQYISL